MKNLEAEIRQRLADTRGLLRKDLPITRQMLRKLATEPILAEAMPDGNGKGVYRFTFKGSYASLLPPVVVPTYMVSPTGSYQGCIQEFRGVIRAA